MPERPNGYWTAALVLESLVAGFGLLHLVGAIICLFTGDVFWGPYPYFIFPALTIASVPAIIAVLVAGPNRLRSPWVGAAALFHSILAYGGFFASISGWLEV